MLDLSPVASGSSASQALHDTIALARATEGQGYQRFWVAEHHNLVSVTSSSPEVMIASVAAATSRIRVGAGGIMLPNHAPLRVAEAFRVLEALHPGRIDLGIGRAPGTDQLTALALRRSREALIANDFPAQFEELRGYVDGFPEGHPFAPIIAQPADVPLPPVWILGSSLYGAQAAAAYGTGFAFAGHFGDADPAEAIGLYRERFRPSGRPGDPTEPRAILAVAAITAATGERAEALGRAASLSMARLRSGHPGPLPSAEEALTHRWTELETHMAQAFSRFTSVGEPAEVRDAIQRRAREADADELMVATNIADPGERVQSYKLLADGEADADEDPGAEGA